MCQSAAFVLSWYVLYMGKVRVRTIAQTNKQYSFLENGKRQDVNIKRHKSAAKRRESTFMDMFKVLIMFYFNDSCHV